MVVGLNMTVRDLTKLLSYHEDDDEVTINNNYIKVVGKFRTDPEGKFCGECNHFDCDKCDWRERK